MMYDSSSTTIGAHEDTLTSISTDGSVLQWSTKKGLVPRAIMQLKRVPNVKQFDVCMYVCVCVCVCMCVCMECVCVYGSVCVCGVYGCNVC